MAFGTRHIGSGLAAVLAATGTIPASAQNIGDPIKNLSAPVTKTLRDAQAAEKNGDLATAKRHVEIARGQISTPGDRWVVGVMGVQIGIKLNDQATQLWAVNEIIDSGQDRSANLPKYYALSAQLSFGARDYDRSIRSARQLIVLDPSNVDARLQLSNAYVELGQGTAAVAALEEAIRLQKEAGQAVPETWTRRLAAINAAIRAPGAPMPTAVAPQVATAGSRPTPSPIPSPTPALASASKPVSQAAAVVRPTPAPMAPGALANVAGPRVALVIGNSAYDARFGRLANPVGDARAMAAALTAAGFQVYLVIDVDQKGMKRAVSRSGQRLVAAGSKATGLFFYAGHGVQSGGTNYLVPINAAIDTEGDVDLEAVSADSVMAQMAAAHTDTSIVILDACRNMPLARAFRDGTRGLARMETPNGSFVAYSTAPGAVAADGAGEHSPFVSALLTEMARPGETIQNVFQNVRRSVYQASGGKQVPWDSSSLIETFVFQPVER